MEGCKTFPVPGQGRGKALLLYKIGDAVVFSSEIKGLFCFPGIEPVVDKEGLCEVLGLGPAKTYGKGVFRGF